MFFFNASPGPCFSPFTYQNATLSTWMGQNQQQYTHLYLPILNDSTTSGPKFTLDWNLETHIIIYVGTPTYNGVLEVLIPQPLRESGRPQGQSP